MRDSDDGCGLVILVAAVLVAVGVVSLAKGYSWGYEAHRQVACERSGGFYVESVESTRRTCVHGGERR